MERSIQFGIFDTWIYWKLILTEKSFAPPEIKTNYVEIDGADGEVDLTEVLASRPVYRSRPYYASFITDEGTWEEREKLLSDLVSKLHGRKMRIIDPDDTERYIYGRVSVKTAQNHPTYASISVEAICDPWRYDNKETEVTYNVDGVHEIALYNYGVATLCPNITVTGTVTFTCNGVTTTASDGTYKIATFKLFEGENVIGLSGSGTLTLKYRRATL